jgi:hypothetical protein
LVLTNWLSVSFMNLAFLEAAPDHHPVLCVLHPPLLPGGVVPEAVLLVPLARNSPAYSVVGDDESEDGEGEEEEDREEARGTAERHGEA